MLNIKLFEEIKRRIRANPERFGMHNWKTDGCKTVMCIGGWAAHLSGKSANDLSVDEMAELLGVEQMVCHSLFFVDQWDEDFRADYYEAEGEGKYEEMAEAACGYIDWFIESYQDECNEDSHWEVIAFS